MGDNATTEPPTLGKRMGPTGNACGGARTRGSGCLDGNPCNHRGPKTGAKALLRRHGGHCQVLRPGATPACVPNRKGGGHAPTGAHGVRELLGQPLRLQLLSRGGGPTLLEKVRYPSGVPLLDGYGRTHHETLDPLNEDLRRYNLLHPRG